MIKKIAAFFFLVCSLFSLNAFAQQNEPPLSYDMGVLVITYLPIAENGSVVDTNAITGGWTFARMQQSVIDQTNTAIAAFTRASKYLGYQNSSVQPSLQYRVVDSFEHIGAVPFKTPSPVPNSQYYVDYSQILQEHNICNYVNNLGVKEVWLFKSSHKINYAHSESKMSGPHGDISNSYRTADMPLCDHTYRVYTHDFLREDLFAEVWGHQLESELYTVDRGLMSRFATSCGTVHNPPNARWEYDRDNPDYINSDCQPWIPNGSGTLSPVSCSNWGCGNGTIQDNPVLNYSVWLWQNMPGYDNGKTFNGKPLRNWWDVHGDFDAVMSQHLSLTQTPPTRGEDLLIRSIKLNPAAPKNYNIVRYSYEIKNQGTADTAPFKVGEIFTNPLNPSGALIEYRAAVEALKSGELRKERGHSAYSALSGVQKFGICADSFYDVGEKNKANNCMFRTYVVGRIQPYTTFPDLYVESFKESPSKLSEGNQLSVIARIKNQGLNFNTDTRARLRIDENSDGNWEFVDYKTVPPLVSNKKYILRWNTAWIAKPGPHTYEICVDVDTTTPEADENNNCVSTSFFVANGTGTSVVPPLTQNLTRESQGSAVTQLQTFLMNEQYLDDTPTGFYGPATEQAVKDLQEDSDLQITGKWDESTRRKIKEMIRKTESPALKINTIKGLDNGLINTLASLRSILENLRGILPNLKY